MLEGTSSRKLARRVDLVAHGRAGDGRLVVAEIELAARTARVLGLQQFVAQTADVHAEFDGVIGVQLGPVADEIDVGLGAIPRHAGGIADQRIGVAADGHGGQPARPAIQIHALDPDGVGRVRADVEVLGLVAVAAQADARFGDERGREQARIVDRRALGAVDAGGREALAAAAVNAEAARVGHHRTLEAVARREAVLVGLLVVDLDVERILVLAARGGCPA